MDNIQSTDVAASAQDKIADNLCFADDLWMLRDRHNRFGSVIASEQVTEILSLAEIFAGGNPTHIDLYPREVDGGYIFVLTSGQIITSRAIEAINAYHALIAANYPVELRDHQKLQDVIRGDDYVGIVPFDVIPRRVGGVFPDGDNVNDSLNLHHMSEDDGSYNDELLLSIEWYPEKTVQLK